MSKRSVSLRAAAAVAGVVLAATAEALDPLEFVAGWPIEAPANAEVFDVPLTVDVYAAVESIEQLAVLDANGEPQSFFRLGQRPAVASEQGVVLEASPLFAGAAGVPSVGVTAGRGGTSVTVTASGSDSPAITSFVLDARAVETVPMALELDWRSLPQPFLLDVVVEQSTDLTRWATVGRASVAALAIGDTEARHARVPVRATVGGYYRITPSGTVADWYLLRATVVSSIGDPPATSSARFAALPADAAPTAAPRGAVFFDAGGPLPVQSVMLAFPADGWVRADVALSRSLDGPWTTVAYGQLFYELSFEGRELKSEPVKVGRQEARYWRVLPASRVRGERLELTVEFPVEQLRVAARGGAPYLLAAGTLAEEAGPDPTLASVWATIESAAPVPLATLGVRRELGGPAVLEVAQPFPWRTTALWTVLIAGVLVVGTMAVRLAREMRSPTS